MSELTLDQVLTQRREANREIVNVDEPTTKLVIFTLTGEWFAFNGERIREILSHTEVFFVPGCPASLEGVINVRGDIESVISLNDLLHLAASEPGRGASILLGRGGGMSSGIRVEEVVDVVDIVQSNIHPPPSTIPDHLRPIVLGILTFKDKPVTVLDLDQIFSDYSRTLG
ncbi:MAG: purine-binding chemotaxis protein CheW [Sulfuricella sp.]|nr:purine-binding chemotaxis protein CheW [Sulfuricella sp.]